MPVGGASETLSTSPLLCALFTAPCPFPTDAERVGDGGGCCASLMLSRGRSIDGMLGLASEGLFSDVLSVGVSKPADEVRGLSVLLEALGIFDLMEPFSDALADSLVSDFEREGY